MKNKEWLLQQITKGSTLDFAQIIKNANSDLFTCEMCKARRFISECPHIEGSEACLYEVCEWLDSIHNCQTHVQRVTMITDFERLYCECGEEMEFVGCYGLEYHYRCPKCQNEYAGRTKYPYKKEEILNDKSSENV